MALERGWTGRWPAPKEPLRARLSSASCWGGLDFQGDYTKNYTTLFGSHLSLAGAVS